jgi:hypothetical protein
VLSDAKNNDIYVASDEWCRCVQNMCGLEEKGGFLYIMLTCFIWGFLAAVWAQPKTIIIVSWWKK